MISFQLSSEPTLQNTRNGSIIILCSLHCTPEWHYRIVCFQPRSWVRRWDCLVSTQILSYQNSEHWWQVSTVRCLMDAASSLQVSLAGSAAADSSYLASVVSRLARYCLLALWMPFRMGTQRFFAITSQVDANSTVSGLGSLWFEYVLTEPTVDVNDTYISAARESEYNHISTKCMFLISVANFFHILICQQHGGLNRIWRILSRPSKIVPLSLEMAMTWWHLTLTVMLGHMLLNTLVKCSSSWTGPQPLYPDWTPTENVKGTLVSNSSSKPRSKLGTHSCDKQALGLTLNYTNGAPGTHPLVLSSRHLPRHPLLLDILDYRVLVLSH